MGKKEDTPLQATIKEDDELRKKLEKAIKTGESQLKKKTIEDNEKIELYKSLKGQQREVDNQIDKVKSLDAAEEPNLKENKFKSKKEDELKKLNTVKDKLTKLEEKAKPEDYEADEVGKLEDEEDSEEEDDDSLGAVTDEAETGEDETEDETESHTKPQTPPQKKDKESVVSKTEKSSKKVEEEDEDEEDDDDEALSESEEESEDETTTSPPAPSPKPRTTQPSGQPAPTKESSSKKTEEEDEEESEEDEESEEEGDEISAKVSQPTKAITPLASKKTEEDDEEDEESEEEVSDEESVEDEDDATVPTEGPTRCVALMEFTAEREGDLSFKVGEPLAIIQFSEDGWYTARNSKGEEGVVPGNYLKKVSEDGEETEEESEGESEEDDDNEQQSPRAKTPRSGRLLWQNIKQAVKEESTTEILLAIGAVAAGFRDSTLAGFASQDHFTLKAFLAPKLSPSCVGYRDLFLNPDTNRIRLRTAKIQRIVQVIQVKQMPAPGVGLEIKSRHIRACLFDGKNMLSNIHTMRVSSVDKTASTWTFNLKTSDVMKSLDFGEFFIRSNTNMSDIGILFEICMSYVRTSSDQKGEFSCGWTFLPLFDQNGTPVENKQYDEKVNGGTPFEKGVEVDPSIGKKAQTSIFRGLMSGNKQPRLVVRLHVPTKDQAEYLNTLPDVVISSTTHMAYLSYYRRVLVDALIRYGDDIQSIEPIYSPLLTSLPEILDQPDLMDVLRGTWNRSSKKVNKKDISALKDLFQRVFMEQVYPIYQAMSQPTFRLADSALEEARRSEIQRIENVNRDNKFLAACLLSADVSHKPFDMKELAFSVIGPNCATHRLL